MNTPSNPITPPPTTVRELIKSVSPIARHLKVSKSAVYRWIGVNRVPGEHLLKLAAHYKYDPTDLLHLTGSEKTNNTRVVLKPRSVLATLLEVYKGEKTLEDALTETGQTRISLTLIQKCWGDRLPTLYTTLEQLDQSRIGLDDACKRLNVTRCTMHGIRRKYGYQPGPVKAKEKPERKSNRKEACRVAALDCISGRTTIRQAAEQVYVCERTLMRAIARLSVVGVSQLNQLLAITRSAYAADIAENDEDYSHLTALKSTESHWLLSKIKGKQ
jgi:transposase-like protein